MVKQYQLENGMQVILLQSKKSPVLSIQAWVRTGSVHESKKEKGVTHFLEHLVFKGTKDFGVGEIAGAVEACGGEINAYTSFDQTVYYVTVPNQEVETGLRVISNMVGYPSLDPVEIDNERGVVIEEIKRGLDSLGRVASQQLFATAFQKHPLGIPVIGYEEVVNTISPKEIRDYHDRRYSPKNMFLLVAGDFDLKGLKPLIEDSFGAISKPKKKISVVSTKKSLAMKSPAVELKTTPFKQSVGYFSWKIPGPKHKDVTGLELLATILGQGESSRLVERLRLKEATVMSVGSSLFNTLDEGLFVISTSFEAKQAEKILNELEEELKKLWEEPISEGEIIKAVNYLLSEEAYSQETVDGLARRFGSLWFYLKDLKADEKYRKTLLSLTARDLQNLARKYLSPSQMILSWTLPDTEKLPTSVVNGWVKKLKGTFAKSSKAPKAPAKKVRHVRWKFGKGGTSSKVELVELPNGDRLLLRKDVSTSVLSAKMTFLGGLRQEPNGKEGLVEMISRVWTCGTKNLSEAQIGLAMDSMGAAISPVAGRNTWGLSLDSLSSFEKKSAELYKEILLNPTFQPDMIDRERSVMIQQLAQRKDNPSQICGRLFLKEIFAGHPYEKDFLGTESSLLKLGQEDLLGFYKSNLQKHTRHSVVSGNIDIGFWKDFWAEISEELGKAKIKHGKWESHPIPPMPTSQKLVFEQLNKEQTHIILGWRGLTMDDPRRYTLQVIQSILAGQGGRLFIELRDKKSLAYSVSPMKLEGLELGYFGAYIGCSPEKVETAIKGIEDEFQKLVDHLVPEKEIERSKRYLIGRHDIDSQRNSEIAAALLYADVYGMDYMESFHYREKMESVTAESVRKVAAELFTRPYVLAVVGNKPPG